MRNEANEVRGNKPQVGLREPHKHPSYKPTKYPGSSRPSAEAQARTFPQELLVKVGSTERKGSDLQQYGI
jgi:hypothetical protein